MGFGKEKRKTKTRAIRYIVFCMEGRGYTYFYNNSFLWKKVLVFCGEKKNIVIWLI